MMFSSSRPRSVVRRQRRQCAPRDAAHVLLEPPHVGHVNLSLFPQKGQNAASAAFGQWEHPASCGCAGGIGSRSLISISIPCRTSCRLSMRSLANSRFTVSSHSLHTALENEMVPHRTRRVTHLTLSARVGSVRQVQRHCQSPVSRHLECYRTGIVAHWRCYFPRTMERAIVSARAKREYVQAIYQRYRRATRPEKGRILTEFCHVAGYHRKSSVRLLNRPAPRAAPRRNLHRPDHRGATGDWGGRRQSLVGAAKGADSAVAAWARRRLRLCPAVERQSRAISARQIGRRLAAQSQDSRLGLPVLQMPRVCLAADPLLQELGRPHRPNVMIA